MNYKQAKKMENLVLAAGHRPVIVKRENDYRVFIRVSKLSSILSYREVFPSTDFLFLKRMVVRSGVRIIAGGH